MNRVGICFLLLLALRCILPLPVAIAVGRLRLCIRLCLLSSISDRKSVV